jgi:hypothetical protein
MHLDAYSSPRVVAAQDVVITTGTTKNGEGREVVMSEEIFWHYGKMQIPIAKQARSEYATLQ